MHMRVHVVLIFARDEVRLLEGVVQVNRGHEGGVS